MINVNQIVENTKVVGPGSRFVIWTQGCKFNCIGCKNLNTHSTDANKMISVDELFNHIISIDELDGVTFSGGEPLLQYDEIFNLIRKIKSETKLNVMLYTGYYVDEIIKLKMNEILDYIDILVDGRFDITNFVEGKLYGSSNQTIITKNYNISDIENVDSCELHINELGEITVLGDLRMIDDII